jgi:hypothetical protein
MRQVGIFLICCGLVGGCASCAEETTVSGHGERIHNLGLIADQLKHLIISGTVTLAGVVFFACGQLARNNKEADEELTCPQCESIVGPGARACRHCGIQLVWDDAGEPVAREEFDRLNQATQATRSRVERERRLEVEAADQRRKKAREAIEKTFGATRLLTGRTLAGFAAIPLGFDRGIRALAGDGNQIVYRFLQALVYVGLPALVVTVTIMLRR